MAQNLINALTTNLIQRDKKKSSPTVVGNAKKEKGKKHIEQGHQ